jgi:hypothetical protein
MTTGRINQVTIPPRTGVLSRRSRREDLNCVPVVSLHWSSFFEDTLVASHPQFTAQKVHYHIQMVNNLKHLVPWSHAIPFVSLCLQETQIRNVIEDCQQSAPVRAPDLDVSSIN